MLHGDAFGLVVGAVLLGAVHGIEPGHGWPVAASYALDRSNKWLSGFAASFILGVGHLISSIAMVAVFFYAKDYFNLTQVNEPIQLVSGVSIGGPVSLVAGILLIVLGIREYTHGHSHGTSGGEESGHHDYSDDSEHFHSKESSHSHSDAVARPYTHDHEHQHGAGEHSHGHVDGHEDDPTDSGLRARIANALPFVGGHSHDSLDGAADRGLLGIAWFAFLLGFAHEEEFEIIGLCATSGYCLELMTVYALTVIAGIVGLTLLLIAGYQQYEDRVEQYTPYLPVLSASVLVVMGVAFIIGVF